MPQKVEENTAGGGAIAGIGVGPQGEPGGKPLRFAGRRMWRVSSTVFEKCRFGKKKHARYKSFVGEDEVGEEIRQYGRKNPDKAIVIQDERTGAMSYLRYGKREKG